MSAKVLPSVIAADRFPPIKNLYILRLGFSAGNLDGVLVGPWRGYAIVSVLPANPRHYPALLNSA